VFFIKNKLIKEFKQKPNAAKICESESVLAPETVSGRDSASYLKTAEAPIPRNNSACCRVTWPCCPGRQSM